MSRVHWLRWTRSPVIELDGTAYDGYWFSEGHSIVLADAHTSDGPLVRHEMLHDLLQVFAHPVSYFDGRCGGVVAGGYGGSAALADPALVARAREVGPEVLTIAVSTLPEQPRVSENDGWFVLDVQAVNPTKQPIWVRLEPFFGRFVGLGYTIAAGGGNGTLDTPTEARMFFAPGQRRHMLFDIHRLTPGPLSVVGFLSGSYSPQYTITVAP